MITKIFGTFLILAIYAIPLISQEIQSENDSRISKVGIYNGYSTEEYDSFQRESVYISMHDGVKIAIDIYRPKKDGLVEKKPLPVIWNHTQYTRALKGPDGKVLTLVSSPIGMTFIKHGYIMVIADARGTGASYGIQKGIFTNESTHDGYEITEWIASQEWCDGNIGMMGGSYEGVTQLMAASTKPPHLKAIFPAMFLFDLYDFPYHNGVFYDDCLISGEEILGKSAQRNIRFISPVDIDSSKILLNEAAAYRKYNRNMYETFSNLKYRDSFDSITQSYPYKEWSPSNYINKINESGVAVYIYGGWYDLFSKDALMLYNNLTTPKKLLMIDSPHSSAKNSKLAMYYVTEQIRWFDYWLKGIKNGIMDEPSIILQKIDAIGNNGFISTDKWPLTNTLYLKMYFFEGPSGTVHSANDGILDIKIPGSTDGEDKYKADYSTTSGTSTRWDDAAIKKFNYPDMITNDEKGITYSTTGKLQRNLIVCGHPVITCWVSSSTSDFDLYAYLEDVDSTGKSKYITEGCIRASYRKLNDSPYNNLGLPYHRSYWEDFSEVNPGEVVELKFDLLPIYYEFRKGHVIRINIVCADKDNTNTHKVLSEPEITLFRNSNYPSNIELPCLTGR
jgi:putative CocE/NonD family hydrolase